MKQQLFKTTYQSPLGKLLLLSSDANLLGIWFEGQNFFGANYRLDQANEQMVKPLKLATKWLEQYFAGLRPDPTTVPIEIEATAFRQQVWHELQKIPYGQTATYLELSDRLQGNRLGKTNMARAIGGAVGHNPFILLIPCHRVIGTDGALTGYAGGLERKKALLAMEQRFKAQS